MRRHVPISLNALSQPGFFALFRATSRCRQATICYIGSHRHALRLENALRHCRRGFDVTDLTCEYSRQPLGIDCAASAVGLGAALNRLDADRLGRERQANRWDRRINNCRM